ncbi:MAG TPA: NUDIX domain-containing protein [Candidatus Saccharimonas sp.]|nr:NUDIX domain-containing protein [Candidatus Saccharimonas sp.]
MNSNPQVRVGIAVFVCKNGKFLMLQRQGAHGAGSWAVPGGHLEFGESFEDTSRREVKEETGLIIKNIRFCAVTNDYFMEENKHYITIWVLSDWSSGKEYIAEPGKCLQQAWHTFEDLPQPLFLPWQQLLASEFIGDIKRQLQTHKLTSI